MSETSGDVVGPFWPGELLPVFKKRSIFSHRFDGLEHFTLRTPRRERKNNVWVERRTERGKLVERWEIKGHQSDVIDIAFSPDGKYLASASYDNLVNVWDVEMKQTVATLRGHQSLVKGVAWDPIGKFLATQGDDKSVIIWRVDDWEKVSTITEPYRQSVGAAFSMLVLESRRKGDHV